MKKAVVTLAVGKYYADSWNMFCRDNWSRYAARWGYDVICIDRPLDSSARAEGRSSAWQKCLVLSQPWSDKYERIVWVDADILINPYAPDISEGVSLEKVGATDQFTYPTAELYQVATYKYSRSHGKGVVDDYPGERFHANWGLPQDFSKVVQTGVLVLNYRYHRDVLEYVYNTYEDKPGLNYEMRPLSYELQKRDAVQWIDARFNALWATYQVLYCPFSLTPILNNSSFWNSRFWRLLRKPATPILNNSGFWRLLRKPTAPAIEVWLRSAYANSYFLHFAACQRDLPLLKWKDVYAASARVPPTSTANHPS